MKKKILCFGDSLTEGWINDGNDFHPYTLKLQKILKKNGKDSYIVENEGISGAKVESEMCRNLQKALQTHQGVKLLILQGGTNDILQLKKPEQSSQLLYHFEKLFHVAKEYNVEKICLLTVMEGFYTAADGATLPQEDCDSIRLQLNSRLTEHVIQNNEEFIFCDIAKELPLFNLTEEQRTLMWDDLLHPSPNGYDKMGEIIYEHIKSFL